MFINNVFKTFSSVVLIKFENLKILFLFLSTYIFLCIFQNVLDSNEFTKN